MSVSSQLRRQLNRVGLEVKRFPESHPAFATATLLRNHNINLVLDVGANQGQYVQEIRSHGYTENVLSFEPTTAAYERLKVASAADGRWHIRNCALGPDNSSVEMNVAGNGAASSSLLPMLNRVMDSAPNAAIIGTEEVQQVRLDDAFQDFSQGPWRGGIFLKLDVQGYEDKVLRGAARLMENPLLVGMQMEISFVPLYDGDMTWEKGFEHVRRSGMTIKSIQPGFTDPTSMQMLQADIIAFR